MVYVQGLVWKRHDFRESSRLITLITKDQGKITVLAKGAHRSNSQCLGKVDFLNSLSLKISKGNLPTVHRVALLHEPRSLRQPRRYLAASYLCEFFDPALPQGRVDDGLFTLLQGGVRLLERCPTGSMPQVLHGLELRFLQELGLLPPLTHCSRCSPETASRPLFADGQSPALFCQAHAAAGSRALPTAILSWLAQLLQCPARQWHGLTPPPRGTDKLLGNWLSLGIERQPKLRAQALAGC